MNKVKIEIKNRWTGSILFEYEKENNTIKDTVEKAVRKGANLREADLEGAYLYVEDNEIDVKSVLENFEEKNKIKIKEWYINKNIIPTKWSCPWKYGLIICNYEIIKEEPLKLTIEQISREKYNGREIKIIEKR